MTSISTTANTSVDFRRIIGTRSFYDMYSPL